MHEKGNQCYICGRSVTDEMLSHVSVSEIDWKELTFHMDEYIGLSKEAPQGFGNFCVTEFFKLPLSTNYINGQAENPHEECIRYAKLLEKYPADMVCMGIGENGHIAFNDPWVADFNDENAVKIVKLDEMCRQQQVNDGCFKSIDDVPKKAITLTIPALIKAKNVFCVVPAETKRIAVYNTVRGEISTKCPASILRKHDNAILFCDADSAIDILLRKAIISDEISQDFEIAARLAKQHECEALEIRSIWDKAPQDLDENDILKINGIKEKYNLSICAISSSVFKCDINDKTAIENSYETFRKSAMLANSVDAKIIRVFTFWKNNNTDNINKIIKHVTEISGMAKKFNVAVAVEPDPSVNCSDAEELYKLFKILDLPNVYILWDPGNQIYNDDFKEPYPKGYRLIKKYIKHIHLKDAVRTEEGLAEGVLLGNGMLDVKGQLNALLNDGYDGFIVLEPHFRLKSKLSEQELMLPGGSKFSDGGYEASRLSLEKLMRLLRI